MSYFFFSSRRRHTRCSRDWSSDVCSSDLNVAPAVFGGANLVLRGPDGLIVTPLPIHQSLALVFAVPDFTVETKRARAALPATLPHADAVRADRKSTRLNSSHGYISYAVFCLKKKNKTTHA